MRKKTEGFRANMGNIAHAAVTEALRYLSKWIHRGHPGPRPRAEAMSTPGEATVIPGEVTLTQPCTGGHHPRIKAARIKNTRRDAAVRRTMNNPGHDRRLLVKLGPVVRIPHQS